MAYHMVSVRDQLEERTGFSRLQRLALHGRSFSHTKYETILENSLFTPLTHSGAAIQVREKIPENSGKY